MTLDPSTQISHIISQSDQDKYQFLSKKLDEGALDFARAFIYCDNSNHSHDRNLALRVSIEKGHIDLALEIISLKDFGDGDEISELIVDLVKKAPLNVISSFMEKLKTMDSDGTYEFALEVVLEAAIKENNNEVVILLIDKFPSLSNENWGLALRNAACKKNLSIFSLILEKGLDQNKFNQSDLNKAILNAASKNSVLFIEIFKNRGLINPGSLGLAMEAAARSKHLETLHYLLNNFEINESIICRAFAEAVGQGNQAIIDLLLSTGFIDESARSMAIRSALKKGNVAIIPQVLALGSVDIFCRSQLAKYYAENGQFEFLNYLIGHGPIRLEERNIAFERAVERNRMDIASLLLSGEITNSRIPPAIIRAASLGTSHFLLALIERGPMNLELRSQALLAAATSFHEECLALLIHHGPFDEHLYSQAVAACQTRPDILAILEHAQVIQPHAYILEDVPGSIHHVSNVAVPPKMEVNVELLKENPRHYLQEVATRGLLRVVFLNPDGTLQAGADAGGLTKQFVHQLIEALVAKDVIHCDEKGLPSFNGNESDLLNLSLFLSAIYQSNEHRLDKIFVGQIFDKKTFHFLQKILNPELSEMQKLHFIANELKDETNELYVNFALKEKPDDDEITLIRSNLCAIYDDSYSGACLEELKKGCLSSIEDGVFKALKLISSGVRDSLKEAILVHPELVSLALQGPESFTKEEIFAKLVCTDSRVLDKVEWIKEKIAAELENPESTWVKRFLFCVTGQPVLPAGSLTFRGTSEKICIAHTCFCTIDLPIAEPSFKAEDAALSPKEKFIKNLEITMSVTEYGLT